MLHQYLIEKLAGELKIAPLNIVREYLEMETLYRLSETELSENLIFYGGTALRLAWESFRFSEDLDFLMAKTSPSNKKILKSALEKVVADNKGVSLEDLYDKRNTLFGLLHVTSDFLKHPIRIKIEISKKKNGLKFENRLLSSPVTVKNVIFPTANQESILKLKEKAIKSRSVPRDWFDYWYLCQKTKRKNELGVGFPFNENDFSREMRRWLPRNNWKIVDTVIIFFKQNKLK